MRGGKIPFRNMGCKRRIRGEGLVCVRGRVFTAGNASLTHAMYPLPLPMFD